MKYFNVNVDLILLCIPLYISISIILAIFFKGQFDYFIKYFPPALFALLLAYVVYVKASDFLNTSILFQISDRALVSNIKINEETGMVYPIFINQGGDALAYNELLERYNELDESARNRILKIKIRFLLDRIYKNTQAVDYYFKTSFGVSRSNNLGWVFKNQSNFEIWDDFDVPNVVDQLKHPTFWLTRASCAKLLQDLTYIQSIKKVNSRNFEIMKNYFMNSGVERMFLNLIENIKSDDSLMVRKISLDTYKMWACNSQIGCEELEKDNKYNFAKAVHHWEEHRTEIIEDFKNGIGLGK